MRKLFAALLLTAAASTAQAAGTFPVTFDSASAQNWIAEPTWLANANAASEPLKAFGGGVGFFAINEPQKAMKWLLKLDGSVAKRYLVIRYMANNLGPMPREYSMWVYDGLHQANILYPNNLKDDGQWHDLIVDLSTYQMLTPITMLAINLQAGDTTPTTLWLSNIDYADTVHAGAELVGATPAP